MFIFIGYYENGVFDEIEVVIRANNLLVLVVYLALYINLSIMFSSSQQNIRKYKTVNTYYGKGVDLSSAASYAVIHCELSQGQEETEEGREPQNVGRSQLALVQDGGRGVKDASSGQTSWRECVVSSRIRSAKDGVESIRLLTRGAKLVWFGTKVKREIRLTSL